jgi:UPF0271 protein
MVSIDLNCDMGESFGNYSIGQDEALLDHVSSANIACGFHGGDASVMHKTVSMAVNKNVAIGAHPGYPDLQGFGRRDMKISPEEVYDIVLYQIGALMAFANAVGTKLNHVKPHGALYNTAANDKALASAIARAVRDADKNLILVGLSGSHLVHEGQHIGLKTASEVFADRSYQEDGTLMPRTSPFALITDPKRAAAQVLEMIFNKTVTTVSGKQIPVVAQTICIHGDGKHALAFAMTIADTLKQHHVHIQKP